MTDQTAFALATQGATFGDQAIAARERQVLRALAARVAELAARPIELEKRQLWYGHNALEATRPLIFCDPENGWNEIISPSALQCEGALARRWEMTLRKEVFWGSTMGDDRVVEPTFTLPHVYTESDWGLHETRIGGQDGGAYTWEAPLKDLGELARLRFPQIAVDNEGTERLRALAEEILGDLLTVRIKTAWWWSLGMTWTLINLRGLGQMMYDMVDQPARLHRLMGFLRDGYLAKLQFLEQNGLLSLNNDGTYVGSGGFGWSHELPQADFADPARPTGLVRPSDMWGFAESQETVGVSPAMFEEFVFQYQLPILERFGLNCYGCCEPLDQRWHIVERAPRLRRVSISSWSDVPRMAERLGDRFIFSYKPRPSDLALPVLDEDMLRADLRQLMASTRNCRVEVIMKDNHTIANDPRRVVRWVQIAREEAERG